MALDDFGALLPSTFEDFRNVEFWDGFFKACKQKPFEWYGEWNELREFVLPVVREAHNILVIGCGNSDLSADMYDEGCTAITNIDFSKPVIKEMMAKNLRKRPLMKWQVMDMTQTKFADGAFDAVVDKGGLDALMGEDTPGSEAAGRKLLAEVARLLAPREGAAYLCVTLAQPHVLRKLLGAFGAGWQVVLDRVAPSPDMAEAALQPVLATVTRLGPGHGAPPVQLGFAPSAVGPNAEQIADICQVVEDESAARRGLDAALQDDPWALLHPGRRVALDLDAARCGTGNGAAGGEASTSGRGANASQDRSSRYTATVLDVGPEAAAKAVRECCVFIVPQGRELEWLFASAEGQWAVGDDCMARRVILVALGRGHVYQGVASVNKELSPLVRDLAPLSVRGSEKAVPILTSEEGIGERRVLADVQSDINGRIVVEDVRMRPEQEQGESDEPAWLRRMVFVSNRSLTQSEAYLQPEEPAPDRAGCAHAGGSPPERGGEPGLAKKGRRRLAKATPADGAAGAPALAPSYDELACEYHAAMVAGLSLICTGLATRRAADPADAGRALVIGLGGGPLPIYWHASLGFSVEAVELDPCVLDLARKHFGFVETAEAPSLSARAGDGLVAVAERAAAVRGGAAQKLDVLIVDASSGDPTLAMSCPSPAFLEPPFLADARACIRNDGLMMVNCVSRSEAAYAGAVAALRAAFAEVYELGAVEDVNRVLFCAPAPLANAGAPNGSWAAAVCAAARLSPLLRAQDDEDDAPDGALLEQLQRLHLLPPAS